MRFVLFVLIIACCSCASIVTTPTWPVSIQSTPSEATVKISDRNGNEVYSGTTPAVVNLKSSAGYFKRNKYSIQISSPGFDSVAVPLKPTLNSWYFGNLLFGGIPGMLVIDPATGAMYKFRKKGIYQSLTKN